jgi:hypothetical protein
MLIPTTNKRENVEYVIKCDFDEVTFDVLNKTKPSCI